MTIASKTVLLDFGYIRAGGVFADVTTKPSVDSTEFDFYRMGAPFVGVGNTTSPVYPNIRFPVREGRPFRDTATRSDINTLLGAGKVNAGAPFVAPFTGTPSYISLRSPVRRGTVFDNRVAKSSINASEFDFYSSGEPYWVTFTGTPPVYNVTQFFMMF